MGKVIFYGAISLDGYLADETDGLQWLFDTNTGEVTTYESFFATIDATIMGRKTYEEAKKILAGTDLYPETDNYVFSKTLSGTLPDATIIAKDLVQFVTQLRKEQTIWIVGGGQLLAPLLTSDLIDEWRIQIAPVLLGRGKRLFQPGDYQKRLTLVDTYKMGELVELHYRKKVSS